MFENGSVMLSAGERHWGPRGQQMRLLGGGGQQGASMVAQGVCGRR